MGRKEATVFYAAVPVRREKSGISRVGRNRRNQSYIMLTIIIQGGLWGAVWGPRGQESKRLNDVTNKEADIGHQCWVIG